MDILFRKKKKKGSVRRSEFIRIKKRKNFFSEKWNEVVQSLEFLSKVNFKMKLKDLKILLLILAMSGFFMGLIFRNIYLAILFAFSAPAVLIEYILIKKEDVAIKLDMQIIKYSELIKNTYLSTHSIQDSIAQNMYRFREPIKTIFQEFVEEVEIFNYYPEDALKNMLKKIESPSLAKLVEQLILCSQDQRFDSSLSAMTMQLNDRRQFLQRWQFLSQDIIKKFTFILVLTNVLVFFTFVSYKEMGEIFLQSSISKPIIAIYCMLQLFALFRTLRKITQVKV